MLARDTILAASPFGGFLRKSEPIAPEVLTEAFSEVARTGLRNRDDGRIAAYAFYAGEFQDEVHRLVTEAGTESVLKRELAAQQRHTYENASEFVDAIARGATEMELVRILRDTEVGWAFSVLLMTYDADPAAVARIANDPDDVSSLVPIFFLIHWVRHEDQPMVLQTLLGASDELRLSCAVQLCLQWIRENIFRGPASSHEILAIVSSAAQTQAIAVFAGLLDDLHRWLEQAKLDGTALNRARSWTDAIERVGRSIIVKPTDIDKILKPAGSRQVQVLAAIVHWQTEPDFPKKVAERIAGHASRLFHDQFASSMRKDVDARLHDAAYPEWVLNPLIHALSYAGLTMDEFRDAYAGLASDRFSQMTRYSVWLRDRPRAICLLAVGGYVAYHRDDKNLLGAVKECAEHAFSQPPHDALFDDNELQKMAGLFGFPMPGA